MVSKHTGIEREANLLFDEAVDQETVVEDVDELFSDLQSTTKE